MAGQEENRAESNINDIMAFDLTGGNSTVTLAEKPDGFSLMVTGYLIAVNFN